MKPILDIRCQSWDVDGLRAEIARRDQIIDALVYQVERNLNAQDTEYGLLQTTVVLEEEVRHRTEELSAALNTLSEVRDEAAAARDEDALHPLFSRHSSAPK